MPFLSVLAVVVSVVLSTVATIAQRLLTPTKPQKVGGALTPTDPGALFTTKDAAVPQQIVIGERRAQGTMVYAEARGLNSVMLLVIAWAGHECSELGDLYFGDELVPLAPNTFGGPLQGEQRAVGKYFFEVLVEDHLGTEDQEASPLMLAFAPDKWTTEHRGLGICYSVISMGYNPDVFTQGMPDIWRVIKGAKVFDPRTSETAYSNNAALVVAWYLANPKFGFACAYGTDIDNDALAAGANACDEDIPLAQGGTEKRYAANGVVSSDIVPADALVKLLSASAGAAYFIGGQWRIDPAVWQPPTLPAFGPGDFRDVFSLQTLLGIDTSFNAIKGKYANPAKLWQPDDFPAITSDAYQAEDGGGRVFKDVSLDLTDSPSMAQRVVTVDLRRARQPLAFTAPLKLKGMLAAVGDVVAFDDPDLGWEAKPFEVVNFKFVFGLADGSATPGIIGVDLDVRETSSEIFDWTSDDEITVDPAPNTSLGDLFSPAPPANLMVEEELYEDRVVKTRAVLTWSPSPDAFVTRYRVRHRPAGGAWTVLADTSAVTAIVENLTAGDWEFGVAGVNAVKASDFVDVPATLAGLSARPEDVEGLSLTRLGGAAILRWTPTVALDVRVGGAVVVKHSALMTGAAWDTATSIGDAIAGADHSAALPLKAGTYLVKFRDSTGQDSANAAAWTTKLSTSIEYANLAALDEDGPGFTGTKTDCSVAAGDLVLDDGVDEGIYAFSAPINLGAVTRCRATVGLTAAIVSTTSFWDSDEISDSTEPWDDQVTGNEADAFVEVRETDDDPSGSPTWGPWNRLDTMEFECWGLDFRARLQRKQADYTIKLSALAVSIDGVV